MPKTRSKTQRGRPPTKGELRTAMINFRTTATMKALAEHLARAEGRSLANFLDCLIRDRCRGGLDRAASASRQQQLTA